MGWQRDPLPTAWVSVQIADRVVRSCDTQAPLSWAEGRERMRRVNLVKLLVFVAFLALLFLGSYFNLFRSAVAE